MSGHPLGDSIRNTAKIKLAYKKVKGFGKQ